MGEYADREWYKTSSKKLIDQYGDVPPPWIYEPRAHPLSMCWRMGGGESHIMILGEWLSQEDKNEQQRIDYLKKHPPLPMWMKWAAQFIWDLGEDSWKMDFNYTPYFQKLKALGFEGVDDFEKEYNDDKWI